MRDLVDAPRRRTQDESLSRAALEDHLFVQFAHAHRPPFGSRKKDTIQAAIRNRAAIQNRQHLRALARRQQVANSVPGNARPQFGKLIRWIASRQQIEYALECPAAQFRKRRRATYNREQIIDRNLRRQWRFFLRARHPRYTWRPR